MNRRSALATWLRFRSREALTASGAVGPPRPWRASGARARTCAEGSSRRALASGDPATPRPHNALDARSAHVEGTGTVEVQVARDRGFRKVVARDLIKTNRRRRPLRRRRALAGLKPYEEYYYRFATRDEQSPVGRFRTALPPDSNAPVRFAFFSCQDFTFGHFNGHALLGERRTSTSWSASAITYTPRGLPTFSVSPPTGRRPRKPPRRPRRRTLEQYRSKYLPFYTDRREPAARACAASR